MTFGESIDLFVADRRRQCARVMMSPVALPPEIEDALAHDRLVDITTTGRRSGRPRRIEIWFHRLDGRIYLCGLPGPRGWYANLLHDPALTLHLKEGVKADLPGRARPIRDPGERRGLIERIVRRAQRESELDAWLSGSPLVEVELLPTPSAPAPAP